MLSYFDVGKKLEPKTAENHAVIIEFKVQEENEKNLSDTVQDALLQIEKREYQILLTAKGFQEGRIRKYGFAFCGKKVLIGSESERQGISKDE